jgi:hypothetical protein
MRTLLHYYKVDLHHLAPNAVSQAAIFAAVCEGYLGMDLLTSFLARVKMIRKG